ncbi:hypothetical protein HPB52_014660 [Rhipicephalus sanguineus]|uniref:Monocarboxylate transporter n=1 Tax=Rhipicephalus sanguineus TaxID=34632 RepID=A0A9D4T0E8_RHISA|nr:hypothetical protein HPB52_014660 [Rhipicephalus sanguineus]
MFTLPFVHIGLSRAAALFALTTILITVVDFGEDNGLSGYDAVSLLTAYAIGDLCSRLITALVLDTRFLSSSATLLSMFVLQAVVMAVMSFESNYWVLLVCCFVTGLSSGGRFFTCTVMVAEEFDEDAISLNLGVMNFVSGIAGFIRPPIIEVHQEPRFLDELPDGPAVGSSSMGTRAGASLELSLVLGHDP